MKLHTVALAKTDNQKQAMIDAVGDVSDIVFLGGDVLVATLIEPEKTAGGVYMPQQRTKESEFQSKVGLILAMGPDAFEVDEGGFKYDGPAAKVGDWVLLRPIDGWQIGIGKKRGDGIHCRLIHFSRIRAILANPDKVW